MRAESGDLAIIQIDAGQGLVRLFNWQAKCDVILQRSYRDVGRGVRCTCTTADVASDFAGGNRMSLIDDHTTAAPPTIHATPRSGPIVFGVQRSRYLLELEAWVPSEIEAISPVVDQLMQLMDAWRCTVDNEFAVELALREALSNAVIHGNRLDPGKSVEIRCRCERGKGVWIIVKDQGKGFDPIALPNPLGPMETQAEHGRGIYLMKLMMDEVSFWRGGTEVRMRKRSALRITTKMPTRRWE